MERQGTCREGCGACCEFVILQVNPQYMEPDRKKWIELHGIRLFRQEGGVWASIRGPCRHLTTEKECGIFGEPERPQVCAGFPYSARDVALLNDWAAAACSYSFEEVAV